MFFFYVCVCCNFKRKILHLLKRRLKTIQNSLKLYFKKLFAIKNESWMSNLRLKVVLTTLVLKNFINKKIAINFWYFGKRFTVKMQNNWNKLIDFMSKNYQITVHQTWRGKVFSESLDGKPVSICFFRLPAFVS